MKFPLSLATFLLAAWTSVAGAQLPAAVGETPVPSLAPMLKRVTPAVVNIATRGTVEEQNPLMNDPFFRRFFDVPNQPRQREFQSAGSGVIVDAKNGYIITNAHVVENATDITVQLLDNRSLKAKVVGADPGSDVAVLKVQAGNLVDLPIADSDRAEVGDFVVAIGNPFGLGHTVTSGIVSALGRSGINPEGYEDFIQTDASINPGNSGGALVNLSGQLVGINSAILSRTGGNIGIGFAIPSNMMRTVMNQLIKYGTVKRGVLGVNIQTLVPEIATSMDLPESTQGALVSQVVEGSAAEKAGVKAGDVITAVNGRPVKDASSLRNSIGLLSIGEKVDLSLLREGKPRRVTATISERDTAAEAKAAGTHSGLEGADIADGPNGVVIRSVAEGSPAAQRGLRANDVILAVGRTRVASVADFQRLTQGQAAFVLQIRRGSAMLVIPIR
ncbi:MAG: DegQ family serine endoprotease [Gammaproteobacteria bacterium]|jgi:Do/DeqQ family serine protease|nr:DegQ family serine endoprotease [Gammaproteobacteria bacterium]MDH5175194.1 DegQ family serine endoprotease [Gammaproteobacteria bacterium]MDH5226254.1 DegQ family serine endoprotease [Gammaproteobacteria bacterium]